MEGNDTSKLQQNYVERMVKNLPVLKASIRMIQRRISG